MHGFTMFAHKPSVIGFLAIIVVPDVMVVDIPALNLGIHVMDFSGTVPS